MWCGGVQVPIGLNNTFEILAATGHTELLRTLFGARVVGVWLAVGFALAQAVTLTTSGRAMGAERGLKPDDGLALVAAACKGHVDTAVLLLERGVPADTPVRLQLSLRQVPKGGAADARFICAHRGFIDIGFQPAGCELRHRHYDSDAIHVLGNAPCLCRTVWAAMAKAAAPHLGGPCGSATAPWYTHCWRAGACIPSSPPFPTSSPTSSLLATMLAERSTPRRASSSRRAGPDTLIGRGRGRLGRRRASPGVADAEGETPLMVAARLGHAGLVIALLDAGADPDAVDQQGWTALQKAMVRRHVEVVNIIVKVLKQAQRFDASTLAC